MASSTPSANNKRIAKNTLLLYMRMFVMMAISLYTSRVVLHALGAVDLGIYNVVGGLVSLLAVINGTLSTGTQRFITYVLGKDDEALIKKTFSISLLFHVLVAVLVILCIETFGLWFLYNKMVIPPERMTAAFWILQFTTISCAFSIIQVPYNATIIAHEKMGAFAYISILSAIFRLAIAITIYYYGGDRLVVYGLLILVADLLIIAIYRIYCVRHYQECRFTYTRDKKLEKEIVVFSAWNLAGVFPSALSSQGFNLMLNTFFGPVINAANAISTQINGAVVNFVNNFQTAANPQITKQYATGEYYGMYRLMVNSAKYSGIIFMFLMIPLLIEMDFVLDVWLGDEVPTYTAVFAQIVLFQNLINAVANPLIMCSVSAGKLKLPAICIGIALILILPISYVLLRMGVSAPVVFAVNLLPWLFRLGFYTWFDRKLIGYVGWDFIKNVVAKLIVVFLVGFSVSFVVHQLVNVNDWLRLIAVTIVSTVVVGCVSLFYAIDKEQRKMILAYAARLKSKI